MKKKPEILDDVCYPKEKTRKKEKDKTSKVKKLIKLSKKTQKKIETKNKSKAPTSRGNNINKNRKKR